MVDQRSDALAVGRRRTRPLHRTAGAAGEGQRRWAKAERVGTTTTELREVHECETPFSP